ncbi:LuxR C-terminal-related transcriptional regulator [Streptomyces sp. TRM70350]|uniref:helix-turn-helix transcriptional regulator n=1 Tax=Streptomyces sp. TRM70350 TaxID=2856165 RepID=UPI001C44135C|nr:LuxR C-terminal-related transcriptional regulator [Streptomyces sp. TRM70350]MBV7696559.1 LuxR C-terminal-related transcriptional regulator [Streptomyces sp. TRM70350]
MQDRIAVQVRALDPISEMGVLTALRPRPEVRLVDGPEDGTVGVVVAEGVNDQTVQLLRSVRANGAESVVVVAGAVDDDGLLASVEAGVGGVIRRQDATADQLVRLITSVHRGAGVMPPDLLGRLLKQVSRLQNHVLTPRGISPTGLTDREASVLRLVAKGFDTAEIARQLAYSERTVKHVLHDVTTRFQLRNRSHAVAYAIREGLI